MDSDKGMEGVLFMKRFTALAASLILCLTATARDDARLLNAIGDVETGHLRNPRGAVGKAGERGRYQMKPEAWTEANKVLRTAARPPCDWSHWQDSVVQDVMAAAYLAAIRTRLKAAGYLNPTPAQLALAWNVGPTAAIARRMIPNDYARRVQNIYFATR